MAINAIPENIDRSETSLACLPTEIQQQIYSLLDVDSFCAVRKVSSWSRWVTLDSVVLRRQLRKLPICPSIEITQTNCVSLDQLLIDATENLPLGLRWTRRPDAQLPLTCELGDQELALKPGGHMRTPQVIIDNLPELFKNAQRNCLIFSNGISNEALLNSWLLAARPNHKKCIVALSSSGLLLAIASEHMLIVYELGKHLLRCEASREFPGGEADCISGLRFEHDDLLLKVSLGSKGKVIYLSSLAVALDRSTAKPTMGQGCYTSGTLDVFLDSSTLKIRTTKGAEASFGRLIGVQILRHTDNGCIFVAQTHGETKSSSHYVLCHTQSKSSIAGVSTVETDSFTELARLESHLSCWSHLLNVHFADHGLGSSENMPSAQEQHPFFAMSRDGTLLALAERDMKSVKSRPATQVFVYHLPIRSSMMALLRVEQSTQITEKSYEVKCFTKMGDMQTEKHQEDERSQRPIPAKVGYDVARIPICLTTFAGEVTDVRFDQVVCNNRNEYMLTVDTANTRRSWDLRWL